MSSKSLHIAFVATLPLKSPTIIGRTLPLATELVKHGHEVELITLDNTVNETQDTPVSITIAGPSFRSGKNKPGLPQLITRYLAGKKGLKQTLLSRENDVVVMVKPHPQNYSALKHTNTPLILDSDDDEGNSSRVNFVEKAWLNKINIKSAQKSRLVTACSPYLVEKYRQICPNKTIELIPTAISETVATESPDLRRYFDLSPDAQIILYIGSLAISSGHRVDQILNVWNELSSSNLKLHLIMVGDGIDSEKIRAQARLLSNNNRVHFFGRFDVKNSENFARQANLLIDPIDDSIANQAKSSFRTLLALKTGTPVITGSIGIRKLLLPETLHKWTFYEPTRSETLAQAVKYGLTNEAHEIFKNETQGLWRKWTWNEIGAKFNSLVEGLVK